MRGNIWRAIQAIATVASFGWGLYQYNQKEHIKEISAVKLANQIEQIVGLQKQIMTQNAINEQLSVENDSIHKVVMASRKLTDAYRLEATVLRKEIEKLKQKLDETIILDLSDDEHWQFFRSWARE